MNIAFLYAIGIYMTLEVDNFGVVPVQNLQKVHLDKFSLEVMQEFEVDGLPLAFITCSTFPIVPSRQTVNQLMPNVYTVLRRMAHDTYRTKEEDREKLFEECLNLDITTLTPLLLSITAKAFLTLKYSKRQLVVKKLESIPGFRIQLAEAPLLEHLYLYNKLLPQNTV